MTTTTEPRVYFRDLLPSSVKKLFGGQYWAHFKTDKIDTIEKVTKLANNRELIAIRYKLVKSPFNYPKYISDEFKIDLADHVEVYKNKDNEWVVIMSPYCCLDTSTGGLEKQKAFIDKGYTIIEPIYADNAVSFIKVFPKRR